MKEILSFNPARPNQRSNYLLTTFASNYDDLARESVENMIRKVDQKQSDPKYKFKSRGIINKLSFYLNLSNPLE